MGNEMKVAFVSVVEDDTGQNKKQIFSVSYKKLVYMDI